MKYIDYLENSKVILDKRNKQIDDLVIYLFSKVSNTILLDKNTLVINNKFSTSILLDNVEFFETKETKDLVIENINHFLDRIRSYFRHNGWYVEKIYVEHTDKIVLFIEFKDLTFKEWFKTIKWI